MKKGVIFPIHLLLLLNILTCGLFYYYWIYKTTKEIKDFTGKEDINPLIEVLLGFFTCGLYFKYWYYKYGKVVYKEMPNQIGMDNTEDKTVMIVLIDIVIFIALFLNIIFSVIIFAISVNYIDNDIDRIFAVLRVIPFSLIYIVNASSLILQDKLNNIWKKADTI
ncbi:DUF4234 domain-containing protein [Brachyspira pilosicoli]|uniref:DUF4234 domain-containing protein n=1 Tax=Brachyspira pilosicoli TaxID=52584 RepID=UPI001C683411|nr:DUF4234 domain-containing protein [Brachyspira pilosicoli]MBW5396193.1 DUF4234 domain-containing protein [Brachyspira pilosicoli]